MFVGSCETDETGSPHAEQNRAGSETAEPQFGQGINAWDLIVRRVGGSYLSGSSSSAAAPNAGWLPSERRNA